MTDPALAASWNFVSGVGGAWTLRIPRIIDDGDMRVSLVSAMRLNGMCDVQKFMTKYSIRPFDSFSWGSQSLFTLAIMENREDVCAMLIEAGADVNHRESSGITSAQRFWLHHLETNAMKALTNFSELEDEYVNLDLTSLHDFIMHGDNEQLARQVKLNPRHSCSSKDVWGATPLHWAATFGNIEAIRILLEAGANVNAVCKRGRSVLHWAVRTESVQCCKILVDAGANVNILDGEGLTVLMSLMGIASDPDEIMDIFLEAGVNVDVQNHTGMTALMSAAQRYSPDACAKILKYGADLELRDHVGGTAMFHAVYYRNDAALSFLVDKGTSLLNLDNRGRSIVHFAAACANPKVMRVLERACIEGVPMDDATVKSWWTWFYDRDTWYRGVRASHEEEFSAFQALVASVKSPPISDPNTISSLGIPGEFPKDE